MTTFFVLGAALTLIPALGDVVPVEVLVEGSGNALLDGRYLLREGPPVASDACWLVDGVYWVHEDDPRFLIQGVRDHEWFIDVGGIDWYYKAEERGCDPGAAELEWSANPGRADARTPSLSVTSAWKSECFYEMVQYETYLWEERYAVCDSAVLFSHRLSADEWVGGLCDVSDEASAAACLQTRCSKDDVPFGDQNCPVEAEGGAPRDEAEPAPPPGSCHCGFFDVPDGPCSRVPDKPFEGCRDCTKSLYQNPDQMDTNPHSACGYDTYEACYNEHDWVGCEWKAWQAGVTPFSFTSVDSLRMAVKWYDENKWGPMSEWDVSRITDMTDLFCADGAACSWPVQSSWNEAEEVDQFDERVVNKNRGFNEDLSAWDTARVTSMENMFRGAAAFNQDVGDWDTSSVTNMECIFHGATAFDQPLDETWLRSTEPGCANDGSSSTTPALRGDEGDGGSCRCALVEGKSCTELVGDVDPDSACVFYAQAQCATEHDWVGCEWDSGVKSSSGSSAGPSIAVVVAVPLVIVAVLALVAGVVCYRTKKTKEPVRARRDDEWRGPPQ